MRSNVVPRSLAFAAAVGFSFLVGMPSALAAPSDRGDRAAEVRANEEHAPDDHAAAGRGSHAEGDIASASTSEPQPASNADFSGSGANQHGTYDSTRDGSPSANGSGDGIAVGQPCAGCVGKADNKNPAGQAPDASDPNSGYECDANSGVAKTNPAHTGCVLSQSTPPAPETPVVAATASVLGVTLTRPTTVAAPSPLAKLATTGPGSDIVHLGLAGVFLVVLGLGLLCPARREPGVLRAALVRRNP